MRGWGDDLEWGMLMQIVPQIVKKQNAEFLVWGGATPLLAPNQAFWL